MEINLFNMSDRRKDIKKTLLQDKYLTYPFSVFDTKSWYWQKNKQFWENIINDKSENIRADLGNTNARGVFSHTARTDNPAFSKYKYDVGISTFDPFLTEILIKWFSLENDIILDPFAGGVVRGAVAGLSDRKYLGVDISSLQIQHNREQWDDIALANNKNNISVKYITADSANIDNVVCEESCDMLLTCPPYWNLEKYSNDENDLSNIKTYEKFIETLANIIKKCYNILKDNSFACIVVSDIRDKNGELIGFVPDTINAFKRAGFKYYNEIILESRIVSLVVRAPRVFDISRKVGKQHQNVLIFYKGDLNNINDKFGKFASV